MVRAEEFFKGLFEVDLAAGELVAAVEIPAQLKDERSVFLELARRHGDYAIVGSSRSHEALRTQACLFRACEQTRSSQAQVARGGEGRAADARGRSLQLSFDQAAPREGPPRSAHGTGSDHHRDGERHAGDAQRCRAPAPGRFPARRAGAHRLAHRLRARRVRRVHPARQRRHRARLPDARGAGGRLPRGHDRRGCPTRRSSRSCRRPSTRKTRCNAASAPREC